MKLSVVIIVKNEEEMIGDCLESVRWAEEVVLLDGGSIDKTLAIAKKYPVRIVRQKVKEMDYAAWRDQGLGKAQGEWVLYLDADERITPLLKNEMQYVVRDMQYVAYAIPRRNFLLGRELKHGGWYPDYQLRFFRKDRLQGWLGTLHERPQFKGEVGKLKNPMIHFQPETIEPALEKSIKWSDIETRLLLNAGHPQITWWRILRMGLTTLFERLLKKQGFRDGTEGWIESVYQSWHTIIVYMKLWEMQRTK